MRCLETTIIFGLLSGWRLSTLLPCLTVTHPLELGTHSNLGDWEVGKSTLRDTGIEPAHVRVFDSDNNALTTNDA